MRSLIKLLVGLFICLIGIGLVRGWFSFSRSKPEPESNKVNINVAIDRGKMRADIKRAEGKVEEEIEKFEGKLPPKGTPVPNNGNFR
jgi:hypothetical protein